MGYLMVRSQRYYFSDHIFLVTSIIAMVQMEFVLVQQAQQASDKDRKQTIYTILAGWLLVGFVCHESLTTAWYFHTTFAVWTAFACGTMMFGLVVIWWWNFLRGALEKPDGADYEKFTQT